MFSNHIVPCFYVPPRLPPMFSFQHHRSSTYFVGHLPKKPPNCFAHPPSHLIISKSKGGVMHFTWTIDLWREWFGKTINSTTPLLVILWWHKDPHMSSDGTIGTHVRRSSHSQVHHLNSHHGHPLLPLNYQITLSTKFGEFHTNTKFFPATLNLDF